ncbi:MAG: AGE family epimerase/isomerase [Rhodoblastus sp.]|nr:AGE family epimerase/isomerase [Rhodoblastus sp.]
MTDRGLEFEFAAWGQWMREYALPLWAVAGFDRTNNRFEERLDFSGRKIADAPIRLMVQGRQIFVYAEAALIGLYPVGRALAISAYHSMVASYYERDGSPGWIFSIHRDGSVASDVRDTYAHAFAMFATAHYFRLTGDRAALDLADRTWAYLDAHLALPAGGFADAAPRPDAIRRQNPHMHLLEAAMWLFDASGERRYLDRAQKIAALFRNAFLDRKTGSVIEYFDDTLAPAQGDAGAIREPGHHYEWAWLLEWMAQASGAAADDSAGRIIRHADAFGWSSDGFIFDEVFADGRVRAPGFRLWPLTEAIKARAVWPHADSAARAARLARTVVALRTKFLAPAVSGGWIDRYAANGARAVEFMPASSLYHLFCAYSQLDRLVSGKAWPDKRAA